MAANRTHTKARASHATTSGGCPGSAWPTSHSRNEIYVVVAERLRTSAFGRKRTFSRHQTVDRVIRAFEVLWRSPHKAALKQADGAKAIAIRWVAANANHSAPLNHGLAPRPSS